MLWADAADASSGAAAAATAAASTLRTSPPSLPLLLAPPSSKHLLRNPIHLITHLITHLILLTHLRLGGVMRQLSAVAGALLRVGGGVAYLLLAARSPHGFRTAENARYHGERKKLWAYATIWQ